MSTAVVVTIVLAGVGYVAKYINDFRLAQRNDRLDRINRQLSDLYGPLFALNAAGARLWAEFWKLHGGDRRAFWSMHPAPPTIDQADAWRLWMTTVFMPLNIEMRDAVVRHAELLREVAMPDCLLDLCAHVAGYETVLKRWSGGSFDPLNPRDNLSVIGFPTEALGHYLEDSWDELKREQSKLLGGR